MKTMSKGKLGKVTHYYDKLGVAVIELSGALKVGDKIKFMRKEEDLFEQEVSSMQFDHKSIDKAGKGKSVGMKTEQKVGDGVEVYKA